MENVDKVIRDGKVAVLVSPGFGAGWSTWNRGLGDRAIFSPGIVNAILDGHDPAMNVAAEFPDSYQGGVSTLTVQWLPIGTLFQIAEYDGSESITVYDTADWKVA